MNKNILIGFLVILAVIFGYISLNKPDSSELEIPTPISDTTEIEKEGTSTTPTNTQKPLLVKNVPKEESPSDLTSLLNKYNINLATLRSAKNVEASTGIYTEFKYDTKETGYTFKALSHEVDNLGLTNTRFNISYKGLPVFSESLTLFFRKDKVTSNSIDLIDIPLSQTPKISKTEAVKLIESAQPSLKGVEPQLGYYDKNTTKSTSTIDYALVWKAGSSAQVILDANTGEILYSFSGVYN